MITAKKPVAVTLDLWRPLAATPATYCHLTATKNIQQSRTNGSNCHATAKGLPLYCHLSGQYRGGSNGSDPSSGLLHGRGLWLLRKWRDVDEHSGVVFVQAEEMSAVRTPVVPERVRTFAHQSKTPFFLHAGQCWTSMTVRSSAYSTGVAWLLVEAA